MPTNKRYPLIVFALLCALISTSVITRAQKKFVIPLTAHDAFANRSQTIQFGVDPLGSICIDTAVGEFSLPAVPPGFEVRFINPGGSAQGCPTSPGVFAWGLGSWKDIRSSDPGISVDTFVVTIHYGAEPPGPDTVTFSWPDLTPYYSGSASMVYVNFDPSCSAQIVEVDMKITNSISFIYSADCGGPMKFRIFTHRESGQPLTVDHIGNQLPKSFSLLQNFPNPFNPSTTIGFAMPRASDVTLKVYNVLGSEIASLLSQFLPAGNYKVELDAGNIGTGVYFYTLRAGGFVETKRLVVMK
ncbi:MAG: hypothetical protein AUI33_04765 [Ignavibacteria bacterium 13_1_40CM_2_61_4]|nr:MAG: hypothetical protein AUI33_04765 [Ignavibacteria bacterium 13_1_40CM_2_61_4]